MHGAPVSACSNNLKTSIHLLGKKEAGENIKWKKVNIHKQVLPRMNTWFYLRKKTPIGH